MSWRSGVTVVGPDSREWIVRRRWVPRLGPETLWGRFRRRTRKARERAGDFADIPDVGCGDELIGGILAFIAVIAILFFLFLVAIPLLVAIVDILILLVLALIAFGFRVLFRRPWIVEAAHAEPPVERALRWKVVGWRASAERCRELAQHLEAGILPPDGEVVEIARSDDARATGSGPTS